MFANVFYAGLVTLPHIRSLLFPLPLFVSFTIFRMPSEVNKKNMLFVRNFAILKSFLNRRDFHFLYILKWSQKFQICFFFFSLTQKYTNSAFCSWYFFLLPQLFSGFSSKSNPHNEDLFLILWKARSHNWFYIWVVTSLKSATRQHG